MDKDWNSGSLTTCSKALRDYSANFVLPADLDDADNALLTQTYNSAVAIKWPGGAPAVLKSPWKNGQEASEQHEQSERRGECPVAGGGEA